METLTPRQKQLLEPVTVYTERITSQLHNIGQSQGTLAQVWSYAGSCLLECNFRPIVWLLAGYSQAHLVTMVNQVVMERDILAYLLEQSLGARGRCLFGAAAMYDEAAVALNEGRPNPAADVLEAHRSRFRATNETMAVERMYQYLSFQHPASPKGRVYAEAK